LARRYRGSFTPFNPAFRPLGEFGTLAPYRLTVRQVIIESSMAVGKHEYGGGSSYVAATGAGERRVARPVTPESVSAATERLMSARWEIHV
jgi:hypothetical protein